MTHPNPHTDERGAAQPFDSLEWRLIGPFRGGLDSRVSVRVLGGLRRKRSPSERTVVIGPPCGDLPRVFGRHRPDSGVRHRKIRLPSERPKTLTHTLDSN